MENLMEAMSLQDTMMEHWKQIFLMQVMVSLKQVQVVFTEKVILVLMYGDAVIITETIPIITITVPMTTVRLLMDATKPT